MPQFVAYRAARRTDQATAYPAILAKAAPVFITQQRKVRDFLADQDRIATIKSDWLYRMASDNHVRARILQENLPMPPAGLGHFSSAGSPLSDSKHCR